MFKALIQTLFPSTKKECTPNFFYFEENPHVSAEVEEAIEKEQTPDPLEKLSKVERHQWALYDFMFGDAHALQAQDELSLFVSSKIDDLLNHPGQLFKALPILPASLTEVLDALKRDDFDVDRLVDLIEHDPAIAAKVIELANSSYYKRGDKAVTDIKAAFMALGAQGMMEGVINGFVSKMAPQSPLYFRQYGDKIWQHSQSTGMITKSLLEAAGHKDLIAQGYLVGLICNLGEMVIYQLMVEALGHIHPDSHPGSRPFKTVMLNHAKRLTCKMIHHWQLPKTIVQYLALQTKFTDSQQVLPALAKAPVAAYVYEANILSGLAMRHHAKAIDADELATIRDTLLVSDEARAWLDGLE